MSWWDVKQYSINQSWAYYCCWQNSLANPLMDCVFITLCFLEQYAMIGLQKNWVHIYRNMWNLSYIWYAVFFGCIISLSPCIDLVICVLFPIRLLFLKFGCSIETKTVAIRSKSWPVIWVWNLAGVALNFDPHWTILTRGSTFNVENWRGEQNSTLKIDVGSKIQRWKLTQSRNSTLKIDPWVKI